MIAQDKYKRKSRMFQQDDLTLRQKWNNAKSETGQKSHSSPQIIVEGKIHHSSPTKMTGALNRQYLQKVKALVKKMENKGSNPLINYAKIIPENLSTFSFSKITMTQLRTTIQKMKSLGSTGEDDLSDKTIKQAISQLEPLLLHMLNRTISTTTYPVPMKTTKIVLIQKTGKDTSSSDGWRPVM